MYIHKIMCVLLKLNLEKYLHEKLYEMKNQQVVYVYILLVNKVYIYINDIKLNIKFIHPWGIMCIIYL